jgi:hypothetical protein
MMPRRQRFELSPNDTNKLLTREPLLIVWLSILKPGLPHYETGKKETLSRSYFALSIPLELDDDGLDSLKREHLS